jgi:predicted RNA-binding protein associated with RNAse of E/G family
MERWRPGDTIALREVWLGRVWEARPATVVQDEPHQRMLHVPAGITAMVAVDDLGRELRLYTDRWTLAERRARRSFLSFAWPEVPYGVLAFWDPDGSFGGWYLNLETPLRRTAIGFDFTDHCLDVLIPPDRSTWTWKDEDELEEAVARGIFSATEAEAFRADGERAVARIIGGEPPFDRDWSAWRPDPDWPVPILPSGWDAEVTEMDLG